MLEPFNVEPRAHNLMLTAGNFGSGMRQLREPPLYPVRDSENRSCRNRLFVARDIGGPRMKHWSV